MMMTTIMMMVMMMYGRIVRSWNRSWLSELANYVNGIENSFGMNAGSTCTECFDRKDDGMESKKMIL